jgi:hypothetical protein
VYPKLESRAEPFCSLRSEPGALGISFFGHQGDD